MRGEMTKVANLKSDLAEVPIAGMTVLILGLGIIYGMGMGTFSLFKSGGPSVAQFLASAIKIPALFLLTLLVTFPSLYVFNALVGSRLNLFAVMRLLIAGMAVILTVLASFGPIVAFFSVSTTSYSFMVLLNVAMCAIAGVLGLAFLRQTLHRLALAHTAHPVTVSTHPATTGTHPAAAGTHPAAADTHPAAADTHPAAADTHPVATDTHPAAADTQPVTTGTHPVTAGTQPVARLTLPVATLKAAALPIPPLPRSQLSPGALDHIEGHILGSHVIGVFRCWTILFALVGSQMGWVLRPFIGDPTMEFTFFRGRDSNFFQAVLEHFLNLFR